MARAQIYTNFPAGQPISRSSSTEHLGAYDEMRLREEQRMQEYHPHAGRPGSSFSSSTTPLVPSPYGTGPGPSNASALPPTNGHQRTRSYDARAPLPPRPQPPQLARPTSMQSSQPYPNTGILNNNGGNGHPRTPNQQVRYNLPDERVYVPTTIPASIGTGSVSGSQKRYDRLADVYSTSGDTVDFARNLGDYVTERCPMSVWIGATIFLMLLGLLFTMFGAFNLPFCTIQPMIPIYLMVAGLLIMLSCGLRIFGLLPKGPSNARRKHLGSDLCLTICEGIVLLINIIWLILGCVWVYGAKQYVHYQTGYSNNGGWGYGGYQQGYGGGYQQNYNSGYMQSSGMFEEHYCYDALYWFAFISVTLQLGLIALAIIVLIIIGCVGAYKETDSMDLE